MANTIYGAVRLDKLQAVYSGNISSLLVSTQTDNGRFVTKGALVDGNRELYNASTPVDVTIEELLLVASVEINYEAGFGIKNFTNKVTVPVTPARAYHLTVGDIITITDINFDGTTVKGQYVIPQNGSNKLKANTAIGATRLSLKVIDKVKLYGESATVVEVVKA